MPQLPSTMTTTGAACQDYELGSDCNFNVVYFHMAWTLIWGMTLGALAGIQMRDHTAGLARRFLNLSSGACFLNLIDSLLPLMTSDPNCFGQFTFAGAVILALAFVFLNEHWCNLFIDFVGEHPLIPGIRGSFRVISFAYMPLAAVVVSDSVGVKLYTQGILDTSVYFLICATITYLMLTIIRRVLVFRYLKKACNCSGLRFVTSYALLDQCRVLGFLAYSLILRGLDDTIMREQVVTGKSLAAYAWFISTVYWGIFLQVFLLFVRMDMNDPMCGHILLQHEDDKVAQKVVDVKQESANTFSVDIEQAGGDWSSPAGADMTKADPQEYGAAYEQNWAADNQNWNAQNEHWDVADKKDAAHF